MSKEFVPVLSVSDLADNSSVALTVNGIELLVCNADGAFHCVENVCSHRALPLSGGRIRRCAIICPEHGMPFDLATGRPKGQLTDKPLRVFETRVVEGWIEVGLSTEIESEGA